MGLEQQAPLTPLRDRSTVGRRAFLSSAGMIATMSAGITGLAAQRYRRGSDPVRYPDPDIVDLDSRFSKYRVTNTSIKKIYQGTLWAEGPAWNGVGRYLIWSDIPNDEQLRWTEEDNHVSRRFRYPAGYSNGNTFDFSGRQISCQHGPRKVVRYEYDGSVTVLADAYSGKGLNAPNDAVVHPGDGSIWFTDPGYGSLSDYEGFRADTGSPQPIQKESIYRVDAAGAIQKVADEPFKPNGLCFSPDLKRLYVADTGKSHYPEAEEIIWVYEVTGTRLRNARRFASMELNGKAGFADGITADEDGNIWASAGWVGEGYDGVHIFTPEGERIGQIRLPEICSNVCFGGSRGNRLFMTASQSVYAVYVGTRGSHMLGT